MLQRPDYNDRFQSNGSNCPRQRVSIASSRCIPIRHIIISFFCDSHHRATKKLKTRTASAASHHKSTNHSINSGLIEKDQHPLLLT
eukprot:scaffold1390_cov138-Cylindrotheca_fusiformis.AAC.32